MIVKIYIILLLLIAVVGTAMTFVVMTNETSKVGKVLHKILVALTIVFIWSLVIGAIVIAIGNSYAMAMIVIR